MYRGYSVEFLFIAIENCTDERVANRYRSFLGRFRKVVSIIRKFYFWTVKKNFSFVSVGLFFFVCVYTRYEWLIIRDAESISYHETLR